MGTPEDKAQRTAGARLDNEERRQTVAKARKYIYDEGYVVNSTKVENLLKPTSLVPTENAFSVFEDVNIFKMLVPDALHEWSLGVIKQSVVHLLRILFIQGKESITEFDHRFSLVPAFGNDTIRSFGVSTSELKKFAARNYEDILECLLPVLEGLFPEPHDDLIQDWIFIMAYTHALAKLRLHTESTLQLLEIVTIEFGKVTRRFKAITCMAYQTTELPREVAARVRREAREAAAREAAQATKSAMPVVVDIPVDCDVPTPPINPVRSFDKEEARTSKPKKEFNMKTYKFHSVSGDYAPSIREFGTVDSFSTQSVSCTKNPLRI
jgi:hypothetical protein